VVGGDDQVERVVEQVDLFVAGVVDARAGRGGHGDGEVELIGQ
jgi:hypothetical protein